MLYYFDSSAAVKRYAPEPGSQWIQTAVLPDTGKAIYLAQIGIVEIAAALGKKVRTAELSPQEYTDALRIFLTDVENEEYLIAPLSDQIVTLAVELTRRHPLRGYDAVHLATAIILNTTLLDAGLPPIIFVSADKSLCNAAQSEGLAVKGFDDH